MASERLSGAQDLLDLTFQSLAMQHMDLKQVELDTAVAKVDELSRQLESLWTDGPGPPKEPFGSRPPPPRSSFSLGGGPELWGGDPLGRPSSPRPPLGRAPPPSEERAPSPRPKVLALPSPGGGRAPSPRPLWPGGGGAERPYEFLGLGGSPRQAEAGGGQVFFPERAPSPRPPAPPPYELHGLYPSFRAQDDLVLKRRPQKSWNESDLDVAYEKKAPGSGGYERSSEGQRLGLVPWRESSLDGGGKDGPFGGHSATLPRNYKVSPLAGERRGGGEGPYRRPGVLPRSWPFSQQPVSRIPVPPPAPGGRPPRHKPLPLSMIFKLQNAFWEQGFGAGGGGPRGLPLAPLAFPRSPQKQPPLAPAPPPPPALSGGEAGPPPPPLPPPPQDPMMELPPSRGAADADPEPELEGLLGGGAGPTGEGTSETDPPPVRPLSPTRLQPLLPPEARADPEFREVARVLAQLPRPLRRRGSMEQCPGGALPPPPCTRQYQKLITRLLHRPPHNPPGDPESPPGPAEEVEPSCSPPPAEPSTSSLPTPELRSALRSASSPRRRPGAPVRFNPLVLLLDAALTGELDVVQQAVAELNDPSQPNEEGITALHNAICGANHAIVDFLIACGADVNSPDSHGWTPLHCAASCNDTAICVALVRHGAACYAPTSDGCLALDKCDPYREGYGECHSYLTEVEQSLGQRHGGVVYALWDYSAAQGDELSFREGDPVTVLRRQPHGEHEWWWAALRGQEGFVPRNYFGLYPRVRPQRKV